MCFICIVSPFTPKPATDIPEECNKNCTTAFGSILGSFQDVVSFSNCNYDTCINSLDSGVVFTKEETGFFKDVFVGIRY